MKQTSFAEILESLTDQSSFESTSSDSFTEGIEPAFVSQIMGSIPSKFKNFKPAITLHHARSKYAQLKIKPRKAATRHPLSVEQFKSYEAILYALELPILDAHTLFPDNFTAFQLKKAYKTAAIKSHPDTGGCHESFLELKKHYEILQQFVKTMTNESII